MTFKMTLKKKKTQKITNVGKHGEKNGTLVHCCTMCVCYKNNMVVPQKLHIELPYDLKILFLGMDPKELQVGT